MSEQEVQPPATEAQGSEAPQSKKKSSDKERLVATYRHPIIDACVNEMFRLATEEQAISRLNNIAENFIVSKEQTEEGEERTVRLWIKGFALNGTERKKGYLGNFAILKYRKTGDKFTIYAEKESIDIASHPQKKRAKQKHPNWGHPLLRVIKKDKLFDEPDEPQDIFMRLHEEFPETSIPCTNKLYLMIYSKKAEEKKPKIVKFVFTIEIDQEDKTKYRIVHRENMYKSADPVYTPKDAVPGEKRTETKGKFTAMVNLKKKK